MPHLRLKGWFASAILFGGLLAQPVPAAYSRRANHRLCVPVVMIVILRKKKGRCIMDRELGLVFSASLDEKVRKDAARYHRSLGFTGADLQNLIRTDTPLYGMDDDGFDRSVLQIRQTVEAAGIRITQAHGPWRYPPQDATPEDRAERQEKMRRALRAARLVGSSYLVLHPIMPFGPADDPDPALLWRLTRDFFAGLLPDAEENGVVLCLENMPMSALSTSSPAACAKMVRELDSPYMKCCLDTGHCAVLGIDPGDAVQQIGGDLLAVLHIHDNDGKRDLHMFPGDGVINWANFRQALDEVGYAGTLSFECRTPVDAFPDDRLSLERRLAAAVELLIG